MVADAYLPMYRRIGGLEWIEIGWGSDAALALAALSEATVQYIVLPSFDSSSSRDEVRERIEGLIREARGNRHRFRLSVPDLEYRTPEENLAEIHEACAAPRADGRAARHQEGGHRGTTHL